MQWLNLINKPVPISYSLLYYYGILMKKTYLHRIAAVLLAAAMALSLAACGEKPQQPQETAPQEAPQKTAQPEAPAETPAETTAVTFIDDLGREVTVDSPKRVVIMLGSYADTWVLAGGKDSIAACAEDSWGDFDLQLADSVASTGSILKPDLEAVISADPDFIIASSNTSSNMELLETFEKMDVPTAYFGVNSFDEYLHMLDICTQITGCRENYQTYGLDVQKQIEEAKTAIDDSKPTALLIRVGGKSCNVKGSSGTVLGELLLDMGAVNIADSDQSLLENLSIEQIMKDDPQFIFVVFQGSDTEASQKNLEETLLSNPAWSSLTAVSEGRYHVMDRTLFHLKPNANWGRSYETLAEILYK